MKQKEAELDQIKTVVTKRFQFKHIGDSMDKILENQTEEIDHFGHSLFQKLEKTPKNENKRQKLATEKFMVNQQLMCAPRTKQLL